METGIDTRLGASYFHQCMAASPVLDRDPVQYASVIGRQIKECSTNGGYVDPRVVLDAREKALAQFQQLLKPTRRREAYPPSSIAHGYQFITDCDNKPYKLSAGVCGVTVTAAVLTGLMGFASVTPLGLGAAVVLGVGAAYAGYRVDQSLTAESVESWVESALKTL